MHRWITCLSLVLLASSLFAAAPTLTVEGDDGNIALDLAAVSIRVTVRGHLARTEYELTYRNSLDRVTGGDFNFPLPADAEVSDLGLWFDGHLRHGVAVERVLARTAYEDVVHRGVDPALAEWSAGRGFHLRVFPIPPKGEKKVLIAYDQELTTDDYLLDVGYRNTVPAFDVKIDSDAASPVEENGMIRIARDAQETAFAALSSEDGTWYASAAMDFEPPARETPPASNIVILYDTSSSSVQQNVALLKRFLTGFLARQQAWSTAEILPFHVDIDDPRRIENAGTPGGAAALERIVDDLQPLGATNLVAVAARLQKIAAALPPSSRIVLVTDGLTSLGDSRDVAASMAKLGAIGRPLLVVHATSTAHDELLANAATATGGWSIDLLRMDPDVAIESAMHLPTSARLSGSDIAPGSILASTKGRFMIAARAKNAITTMPVSINAGGRTATRELPVRELRGEIESSMVRRAWARARLRELMAGGASDDDLIAHGRAFTQLTPRTSLLVLETWRDYEQYDIPMPPDVVIEKQRDEAARSAALLPRNLPPAKVTPGGWSLKGRVMDSSGVEIPGVTVILKDGDVDVSADITDVEGRFLVGSPVAPNAPRIVAALDGFNPSIRSLESSPPSGGSVDLTLQLAAVSESITVTASAPIVDTMATVASSVAPTPSLRGVVVSKDNLLAMIAGETSDSDDPEVRAAVAKQRRDLTRSVIDRLRAIGSTSERLRYYLSARALLGGDKGFHVFAAEVFHERSPEIAARVLSDLAEARPDDAPLLRILARVLDGWGEESLARLLLQRAIEIAPTQPQSWREIILLEARHGRPNGVVSWSKRLHAAKKNADMEEVYQQTDEALTRWSEASLFERQRGVEVRTNRDDDLTLELMFDTGWCYVDLHVLEPSGEEVTWNHTESAAGARFTGGYTLGFGPEIYTLPHAPRGTYRLAVDYWSEDDTNVSTETLVHVIMHQRGERRDHFIVLAEAKENLPLTTVEVK